MEITIRRLSAEDLDAVSGIEAASFSMPWSRKAFEGVLRDSDSLYLVAEVSGQVAGCCGVTNILGEGDINNVAVDPGYRGNGIARRLMAELLRQGKDIGIEEFTLEVRVSNSAAIRIYEELGFVSEGIRPGFYDKPREDAMIMWLRH